MESELTIDSGFVKPLLAVNGFQLFTGVSSNTPLVINTNRQCRFVRFQLNGLNILNLDKILVGNVQGENLLEGADIFVSSSFEQQTRFNGRRLIVGKPTGGVNYHSEREVDPWIVIDLKQVKAISTIMVFNRNDRFFYRAMNMVVSSSNDLKSWSVFHDNYAFKFSQDYMQLNQTQQALVDCAAMDISSLSDLITKYEANGEKDTALALLHAANSFLHQVDLALGPHGLTQTFEVKSEQQKKQAYSQLSQFLADLKQGFGVNAFVSSGTLLGFARNGEFLAHDDDLDICYISNESTPEKIVKERKEIIAFLVDKAYRVAESDVAHLWVHSREDVQFDLFTGWIKNDRCMMNPLPLPGVAVSDVLPLQTMDSHGYPIMLPAKPEALMVLNYGENWQVPDPLWKFDWSHAPKLYDFLYFVK
jgi:hypothetical protein